MIVVLDTNALHGDVYAQGGWLQALFGAAEERNDLEVWVPAVVVDELARQFPQRLEGIRRLLKQHGHDLSAFGLERPEVPDVNLEAVTYRSTLESRLNGKNRRVVDHPATIGRAVTWAAQRRRPIKADGTGVADAAVWLTVLEAAQKDPHVVLVTNNHQDFGDSKDRSRPHPTLRQDLEDEGVSPARVQIVPRVLDFNTQHVQPSHEATREARALLDDEERRAELEFEIEDAAGWFGRELDTSDWEFDVEIDDAHLAGFAVEELELIRADPGPKGLSMTLTARGPARFELGLFKGEAYGLPDDSPIQVYDYDWNESMAAAELETTAEMTIEVHPSNGDFAVSIDEVFPAT